MPWLQRLIRRPAPEQVRAPLVVGIGSVKNEQDVIEPFVRHNLRFLDALVLVDNGSVDATRTILAGLTQELPGVVVADVPRFGHHQAARVTRLLRNVQESFFADFIVPLDADEFIRAADRTAFHAALARIPAGGLALIPWQTFVPTPAESGRDPPRSLRRRRAAEVPLYAKLILRLDGASARGIAIEHGSHAARRDGAPIAHSLLFQDLVLIHAPVRDLPQLVGKSVVGSMADLERAPDAREPSDTYHKRLLFDAIADGRTLTDADVTDLALGYAQEDAAGDWQARTVEDAPDWQYRRSLSDGSALESLPMIARSWKRAQVPATPPLTVDSGSFDVPPFRFLMDRFRPASMLEIGCGVGGYVKLFAQFGASAIGVDARPLDGTILAQVDYRRHDPATQLDLGTSYDLVLCLDGAAAVLDDILRHAGHTIVVAAPDVARCLAAFRARHWLPEWLDTAGFRCMASLAGLRRNGLVLRRADDVAQDGTRRLEAIAARDFVPYDQAPGVRASIVDEPDPVGGYV